jgi:hypothetical protein
MSTSTTIIISIATTTSTAMLAARDKVIGSTMRNIGGMLPMGTGKLRISTAARLEAKVEGGPVLELELVQVQAELELVQVVPELELVQVAGELEHVQVAAELELVRAAVALGLVQAAAVPGLVQAAVVPELVIDQGEAELELVRAAVALRTKSVTAAHRRDLVLRLAAEDLAAAVAETTREPAATEAVIAWEVAE